MFQSSILKYTIENIFSEPTIQKSIDISPVRTWLTVGDRIEARSLIETNKVSSRWDYYGYNYLTDHQGLTQSLNCQESCPLKGSCEKNVVILMSHTVYETKIN